MIPWEKLNCFCLISGINLLQNELFLIPKNQYNYITKDYCESFIFASKGMQNETLNICARVFSNKCCISQMEMNYNRKDINFIIRQVCSFVLQSFIYFKDWIDKNKSLVSKSCHRTKHLWINHWLEVHCTVSINTHYTDLLADQWKFFEGFFFF